MKAGIGRGVPRESPGVRREAWSGLSPTALGGASTHPHPHLDLRLPASRTRMVNLPFVPLPLSCQMNTHVVYFLNIHIHSTLRLKQHWLTAGFCDRSLCDGNLTHNLSGDHFFCLRSAQSQGKLKLSFPPLRAKLQLSAPAHGFLLLDRLHCFLRLFPLESRAWSKDYDPGSG